MFIDYEMYYYCTNHNDYTQITQSSGMGETKRSEGVSQRSSKIIISISIITILSPF